MTTRFVFKNGHWKKVKLLSLRDGYGCFGDGDGGGSGFGPGHGWGGGLSNGSGNGFGFGYGEYQ